MRDIFLAVALIWCLWNTYDLHHNYKQDKRSEVIDKLTLKILQIHTKRLDHLYEELGMEDIPENKEDNIYNG